MDSIACANFWTEMDGLEVTRDYEKLNKAPPTRNICDVCGKRASKRCARCREAFYCKRKCQVEGWKKHRFECSCLPVGELTYPAKLDPSAYQELDNEVRRISTVLQGWQKWHMEGRSQGTLPSAEDYPPLRDIVLPPAYSSEGYTRIMPDDSFCAHFIRIFRLFAVHWVASMNKDDALKIDDIEQTLTSRLAAMSFNTITDLKIWLPKLLCRTANLSPIEYVNVPRTIWKISTKGGNNPLLGLEADMDDGGAAYAMRLMNLMGIANAVHKILNPVLSEQR